MRLTEKQLGRIASALAEPRRYRILREVGARGAEGMPCSDIVQRHRVSHATISHHLKELALAELIEVEREGKSNRVRLRRDVWRAYLAKLAAL